MKNKSGRTQIARRSLQIIEDGYYIPENGATKKYYQIELLIKLYPNEKGRN